MSVFGRVAASCAQRLRMRLPLLRPALNAQSRLASAQAAAVEPTSYTPIVSSMHWLAGTTLIGSVGAVLYSQKIKDKEEKGKWMFYHKSLGLLTGLLIVPRVVFRLASKTPGRLAGSSAIEHLAATASHFALYAFMIIMPATGIAMGYYSGKGLPFFWTTVPGAAQADGKIAKQAFNVHKFVGVYGKFLVPLHIGAAGFHAVKGQAIFSRINPFK